MYVGNTPPSVTLQRSNNEGLRWVTGDFIGFAKTLCRIKRKLSGRQDLTKEGTSNTRETYTLT